jgi:2'-5' RNA ligase
MKTFKRTLIALLAMAMMVMGLSTLSFAAASPTAKKISTASITIKSVTYDGKSHTPKVTVTSDGVKLVEGTDYTVSSVKKTAAGSYTVKITGMGLFTSSTTRKFVIEKADLDDATATAASVVYDGTKQTADITVTVNGKELKSSDYTVSNATKTAAGTYTVKITGKGNYTGSTTAKFKITPAKASKFKVTVKSVTYNGKAQTAKVTVKDAAGKTLKVNKDYTVDTVKKTAAGTYDVTITGIGNYTSTKTVDFVIKKAAQPAKATVSGKTTITVKASDLKKKAKTYTIKVAKAQGKVTYKTYSEGITVKNGKLVIAKGTKAGTYRVKVRVAGTANYEAAEDQFVTIKVVK